MPTAEPTGQNSPCPSIERLARSMRKSLKKFISRVPELMFGEDPAAVHDVRVSSRRLQQGLAVLFPKPRPVKVRRLRKTLRRIRALLADWRGCDVMSNLVALEERRAEGPAEREAWQLVRDYLGEKRERQVARAREKLVKYDLDDFARRARKLLDRPTQNEDREAWKTHWQVAMDKAWTQWHAALTQAQQTRNASDIHQFRIVTKRLRYRIELAHELGDKDKATLIHELKQLQDATGLWHDRQDIYEVMAEAVARPELLLAEPGKVRLLLSELEKDRLQQRQVLDEIFRMASAVPSWKRLKSSSGEVPAG